MSSYFFYRVYGLVVRSAFEIPELAPEKSVRYDVSIESGACPSALPESAGTQGWAQFGPGRCLIKIPGISRYLVEGGSAIIVDQGFCSGPVNGSAVPPPDVRAYLLGSAFAAILHQRGSLPLHVSAIQSRSAVWAFTGESGAGKSTLVGYMGQKAHYSIVTDDVATVQLDADGAWLNEGPRKLRLWKDAVDQLGLGGHDLRQELTGTDKFQVYLDPDDVSEKHKFICLIELVRKDAEHAQPCLEPLSGAEATRVLINSIYRPAIANQHRSPRDLSRDVFALASRIKVFRFRREWSLENLGEGSNQIMSMIDHYDRHQEFVLPENKTAPL